ncbi:MAG TPA: SDR family NAD(P)-dependent oxidoreductase [Solirubrobacteraceae bacterium]|jgi:NAD(P)-dependent dehydrogenase (short-subunit alcohol dehydrogenase family)|nr:SDR family NAD(P)-dependent oxidoreductase [Solirubrobacteraceae bacterium]
MTSQPRTVLITGATDGLGRALADRLAADGENLILHGRDQDKLDQAATDIASQHGRRPVTVTADLAELRQVRDLAAAVRERTGRLDVLVSNAGIGSGEPDGRERRVSADGYELRFAVNYLAGFLLTQELLDLLRASAPARIVNVASIGQAQLDFDDLMLERGYSGVRAYGQSKLAQIMSGFTLAQQLPADQVTVNSLHPSTYMPTKIVLQEIGTSTDTLEAGTDATRRLTSSPELDGVTGEFYDRTTPARAHEQAYDPSARGELHRRSLQLVG